MPLDKFAGILYNDTRQNSRAFIRNMRQLFYFFVAFAVISPALAEGEQPQSLDKTAVVATASYVDGAYNAIDTAKQDKLTSTNVVESGSGAIVTGITANNGTVTVTKSEVTVPFGAMTSDVRAAVWIE